MRTIRTLLMSGLLIGSLFAGSALGSGSDFELRVGEPGRPTMLAQSPMKDIVDTAVEAGNFKILVQAVQEAGLVQTLKGPGPFTVFAPTDEAFGRLPAGTLDALLKDKQKLTAILTYHVVSGRLLAADVTTMKSAKTVNGQDVMFSIKDGSAMIDRAKIVKTDIMTSNGVIHVIDHVILPK